MMSHKNWEYIEYTHNNIIIDFKWLFAKRIGTYFDFIGVFFSLYVYFESDDSIKLIINIEYIIQWECIQNKQ